MRLLSPTTPADIDALTAVVGKGWTKGIISAIPVRGPSVAVVGSGEGKRDGVGRTRQRVWDRGARGVRR